ncbi:uncharacterized protein LOC143884866 [Tasmannia lanceolata]|uniref:uncharacterized protein LOC143884866 n=1 Tax=Tasmannia lanceolata TaxID=3420 RepID=UPI004063EF40
MKAILIRSVSATSSALGSPRGLFSDQDSGTGVSFLGRNASASAKSALHFENREKRQVPTIFRRAFSETDLFRSGIGSFNSFRSLSQSFSSITEEDDLVKQSPDLQRESKEDGGSLNLKAKALDLGISDRAAGIRQEKEVFTEELEFSDGGMGKGRKIGGGKRGGSDGKGSFNGESADQNRIGAYYKEMLKANPRNPLLLRNYGKFLHEVERDLERAEEYYGRAILESPGDGELLSLYGKLIWEAKRDEGRAQGYFDQAIKASPDDCYVLGSYAHFLWDAEEKEEDDIEMESKLSPLVQAF